MIDLFCVSDTVLYARDKKIYMNFSYPQGIYHLVWKTDIKP